MFNTPRILSRSKCLYSRGNIRQFSFLSTMSAFEYVGGSMMNPTTIFAHALESIHQFSGLGWTGTIVAFTMSMRLILLPAYIKQTRATITAGNLKGDVDNFQSRIQSLRANNQIPEARQELQEMYKFLRANNCHPSRTILLSLLPLPMFMSTFFALRNMSNQPIESFLNGGWAWFENLTLADPFYILPVVSTLTMLTSFEVNLNLFI